MAEVDDPDDRCGHATEDEGAVTAAKVLMSFKNGRLPLAAPPPPLYWGSKGKRSRTIAMAGILEARREEEEEELAAAKVNGKMRASPPSPLDYRGGSGTSTSGGENGPSSPEEVPAVKRPRLGEPLAVRGDSPRPTKVVWSERSPLVSSVPARKSIKPSGKKKAIPELQAMEKALLEEREKLQKEVEEQRKDHEALLDQNRRLKLSLELLQMKRTVSMVPIETKQPESSNHIALSSPVQDHGDFVLPDLNEPVLDL
ncbi:uncharacterized protein [Elaeis guineensis]|uniref:Uncharacterized protein LOC105039083 isoform X2 n=1 Tax=Elaeis guineensis var. tenera TaxID=51953 RepID=A0A6I9QSB6_ELAGV|nr:uncharacterized protein LOC105039083 isoform X2 [Elaeis guineensis]